MSDKDRTQRLLETLLSTRDDEIDCDTLFQHAAELVERGIDDPELRARIEHHLNMCEECAEELAVLRRAVDE